MPNEVPDLSELRRAKQAEEERSLRERFVAELKSRPFGYIVLGLFLLAGPVVATYLFPDAPPAAAAVGGLAFGVYAALCAVPQKFL